MLTHLSIHHLRNLQSVQLTLAQCNVFVGVNGSGKTSLLESLHLLSRGKSFRHAQPKRYISHHQPHTTVHARFANGESMAIQKSQDASTVLRLGQQTVYVQSALAKQLPTLLIDPSSMDVLEVGSGSRRQLLDWITFHVEHGFHSQWVAYQRLLKQRNALLKQSHRLTTLQKQELASWDKGLANHAALITHYRTLVFDAWQPLFNELIKQLLPDYAPYIQLRFLPGYSTEVPFDELLQSRLEQDSHLGYTRVGCHRADVQVLWIDNKDIRQQINDDKVTDSRDNNSHLNNSQANNRHISNGQVDSNQADQSNQETDDGINNKATATDSFSDGRNEAFIDVDETEYVDPIMGSVREQAANVLSRGEKKLLITALRLSQLPLLMIDTIHQTNPSTSTSTSTSIIPHENDAQTDAILPLVLLDDITAELDERALNILLKTLSELRCQVFITSLDDSILSTILKYWAEIKTFHVKHGTIQAVDNNSNKI